MAAKPKHRHPGKKMGKPSPTKRRYAKARAEGETMRGAARVAGLTSKRALQGVTGGEWEGNGPRADPAVVALIVDYTQQQMDAAEVNGRLAAMARGQLPARETSKFGEEKHQLKALETLGHHLGLRKSHISLNVNDRPDLSGLSDEEIEQLLALEEKAKEAHARDGRAT